MELYHGTFHKAEFLETKHQLNGCEAGIEASQEPYTPVYRRMSVVSPQHLHPTEHTIRNRKFLGCLSR